MSRRWTLLAVLGAAGLAAAYSLHRILAQPTGFVRREYVDAEGWVYPYHVFVPHEYGSRGVWPTIVYLHGSWATGYDDDKPIQDALGMVMRERQGEFPFLAVFPQSVDRTWNADSDDGRRVLAILDEVRKDYAVDAGRVYLTGYSMGGGGTWSLAAAYPESWAAIAPVCGYGNPAWGKALARVPCWCFHGAMDTVIPAERSRAMVEATQAAGGSVRYTEYPAEGHGAWRTAYSTGELYEWLLTHEKTTRRSRKD